MSCGALSLEQAALSARGLGPRHPRSVAIDAALDSCADAKPSPAECEDARRSERELATRYGARHPELRAAAAQVALCQAAPVAVVNAPHFAFNGVTLGEPVSRFMQHEELASALCDTDAIQEKQRRIWFFAPCKKARALANHTVLTLFSSPEREPKTAKVDAVAWFFGNHPAIEFPARIGSAQAQLEATLGAGTRLFDLDGIVDGGRALLVFSYASNVYSVLRAGSAIGFVVGKMGKNREQEEWRGLIANLLKFERTHTRP